MTSLPTLIRQLPSALAVFSACAVVVVESRVARLATALPSSRTLLELLTVCTAVVAVCAFLEGLPI